MVRCAVVVGLGKGKPLRLLLVEDSDDDANLLMLAMQKGGFDIACERVMTQSALKAALQWKAWDVIISSYSLPRYNGLTALADARATMKDIPFILVSRAVDESIAVTAMKAGAQDYVLKSHLSRLPAVVEREVREAEMRADRRAMQERLVISERRAIAGTPPRGRVLLVDDHEAFGKLIRWNLGPHHDVVALTSGKEAISRIAAGEKFDVIISDLTMPGSTGMDLYEELLRTAPDLARRIIFMTGGAFTTKAREFLARVANPRVDKPFETTTLLAVISGFLR